MSDRSESEVQTEPNQTKGGAEKKQRDQGIKPIIASTCCEAVTLAHNTKAVSLPAARYHTFTLRAKAKQAA
jgi:hypothetical protein